MKRHQIILFIAVLCLFFLTIVAFSVADLTTVQHMVNMVWSG